MHVGIDFDNTMVLYDDVFHECALKRGLIPRNTPRSKNAIRDVIRLLQDGERQWIDLQSWVYAKKMGCALPAPGVRVFFDMCRRRGWEISIISHKTRYPNTGPRIDMHDVSRRWLQQQGFLTGSGLGLEKSVFFEETRAAKINRIVIRHCAIFIDDLVEVFLEPEFPAKVQKILYAPALGSNPGADIRVASSWGEISARLFDEPE